jgi:hypothetical protein
MGFVPDKRLVNLLLVCNFIKLGDHAFDLKQVIEVASGQHKIGNGFAFWIGKQKC